MFSRKNVKKMLLIAVMATFSNSVFAVGVAEQIKAINEDVAVLSAKFAEMEIKAKIAGKQQEIDRLGASASASPLDSAARELPVVRSIEGVDGRMKAILATGGGATQTVVRGDKVGEWTINKIDVNSVSMARGKQIVRLGFGTEPPITPQTQGGIPAAGFAPAGMR